jgi:hypothetical protein
MLEIPELEVAEETDADAAVAADPATPVIKWNAWNDIDTLV